MVCSSMAKFGVVSLSVNHVECSHLASALRLAVEAVDIPEFVPCKPGMWLGPDGHAWELMHNRTLNMPLMVNNQEAVQVRQINMPHKTYVPGKDIADYGFAGGWTVFCNSKGQWELQRYPGNNHIFTTTVNTEGNLVSIYSPEYRPEEP